jgi:diguanylate cyclase (GGDEF)-like protein
LEQSGLRVLVIDADPLVCRQAQEALRNAGYTVRTASAVWDAHKLIRAERPAMIIASLRLADTNGVAFRNEMLRDPVLRDIPFLFLTEAGEVEQEIQALRSRVDDFVEKPINAKVLAERVNAVLVRRAAYDEMVRVDPLTRLLRRASLEREVECQIALAATAGRTDSAVLIDPDDITRLNREHGWTMGDLMLTCLAGIICTNIRAEDIAGRLGEDKFLLYLPATPLAGAEVLVHRIDALLKTVSAATSGTSIGLAAGVVEVPGEGDAFQIIVSRAREAVDAGKRQGKNRLTLWRDIREPVSS